MKIILFEEGVRLFKGVCLLFLPKFPEGTFILGATFIRNFRVNHFGKYSLEIPGYMMNYIKRQNDHCILT